MKHINVHNFEEFRPYALYNKNSRLNAVNMIPLLNIVVTLKQFEISGYISVLQCDCLPFVLNNYLYNLRIPLISL